MSAEPFQIHFEDHQLEELRRRLRGAIWPDDFENQDWRFGVERGWLEGMASYWANEFDWRAQEREMNKHAHFKVEIDGIPIHFMFLKGQGKKSLPLVLTHGWPWTFWDYARVAARLADPAAFGDDPALSFDVVVPSLPGYTLSSPLRKAFIGAAEVADLWVKLMRDVLGHDRFLAAGGDWGGRVTGELGLRHPGTVEAIYLTFPILPGTNPFEIPHADFAPDEQWMIEQLKAALPLITSHLGVHRSDPQTLAYALQDSPLGLAAWIWERRRAWSDCDGDVIGLYGKDFLCTNTSLYWLTGSIGTSMRSYVNKHAAKSVGRDGPRIETPTAFGIAPKDLVMLPKSWAEQRTNLQHWKILPRGGHFLPAEQPDTVVAEYREFFSRWA